MAKDPAFLFYPGDAAEDVSHMNRLERGAYFDFVQAQKKFGPITLDTIKKIFGKDFDACWPAIKMCLTYEKDMYFIPWLKESVEKRKKYSESRAKNRKGQNQFKNEHQPSTYVNHMENGNGNGNEEGSKKGVLETKPSFGEYQSWLTQIKNGEDLYWPQLCRDAKLSINGKLEDLCTRYLGLLAEYPRKQPMDQHKFRLAFIAYCVENKDSKAGPNTNRDWSKL